MNSLSTKSGHAEKETKLVQVNKRIPREPWTNRTTKIIQKYCKYHDKICDFTEKGLKCKEQRRELNIGNNKKDLRCKCRICKDTNAENFYKNEFYTCKKCKKEYDKERNNQWDVLVKQCYRTALRSHGNNEMENSISLEECHDLLENQNFRCNHCLTKLTSVQGTVEYPNPDRASLDRINTQIIGYGNGNAQWLCVSCNKGKCTMDDKKHKEKFHRLFRRIMYLEKLLEENNINFEIVNENELYGDEKLETEEETRRRRNRRRNRRNRRRNYFTY